MSSETRVPGAPGRTLLFLLGAALLAGCTTPPDALARYDEEPAGLYRGVVAKERLTGTFFVEYQTESKNGTGEPIFHFSLEYQGEGIDERTTGLSDDFEDGRRLCYAGSLGSGEQELSAELVLELTPTILERSSGEWE